MQGAAVIAASGQGLRMGTSTRKQFMLLNGVPILAWAVNAFCKHPRMEEIVVVIPPGELANTRKILKPHCPIDRIRLIEGGSRRQDSVFIGLQAVDPRVELVCIHDGARPLVTRKLIDRTIDTAQHLGAAVPVVPVTDTIKRIDNNSQIEATLPRNSLRRAQTPQVFRLSLILEAYRKASLLGIEATDDSYLLELLGEPVYTVEGEAANIKITTPMDLLIAEVLMKGEL